MSAAFAELSEGTLKCRVGGDSLDGVGKGPQEVVVAPEVREVGEREVDGVGDGAGAAQGLKLGLLAIAAGHATRMRTRAERALGCR